MARIFLLFLILFVFEPGIPGYTHRARVPGKWVVEKGSSLNIQGETNINRFQCDVTEYLNADTLFYASNEVARKLFFTNSSLHVDVRRFDCHNKIITNDFRAALKTDKYPVLKIVFLSLDTFLDAGTVQSIKGMVDIVLGDVVKKAEICYTVKRLEGERIELTGSQEFVFSDFGLKPPRKMGGMIRTRNKIRINFRLFLRGTV